MDFLRTKKNCKYWWIVLISEVHCTNSSSIKSHGCYRPISPTTQMAWHMIVRNRIKHYLLPWVLNKSHVLFSFNGPFAVLISYLAELHRTELRARVILFTSLFYTIANTTLPLLAWAILTKDMDFYIFNYFGKSVPQAFSLSTTEYA